MILREDLRDLTHTHVLYNMVAEMEEKYGGSRGHLPTRWRLVLVVVAKCLRMKIEDKNPEVCVISGKSFGSLPCINFFKLISQCFGRLLLLEYSRNRDRVGSNLQRTKCLTIELGCLMQGLNSISQSFKG